MSSHREAPSISQDPVADNADTYAFVSPDDPSTVQNEDTFLYNTGPIGSLTDPNWNKRQLYSVSVIRSSGRDSDDNRGPGAMLGSDLACPPCNIGPRSTPDYDSLAAAAVHSLPGGV